MRLKFLLTWALLVCLATNSRADFSFNVANPAVAGNPSVTSPYATVGVAGDTSTGKVTFKVDVAPQDAAKFSAFGFNFGHGVTAGDFSLASLSGAGGNTASWALHGPGQMDGFGHFDAEVGPANNAAGNRLTDLLFTLQMKPGKFGEADPANFLISNSGAGNAPHTFDYALEYFPKSGNTGFVGAPCNNMPEPSSLVLSLVGCGMGACVCGVRKWRGLKSTPTVGAA